MRAVDFEAVLAGIAGATDDDVAHDLCRIELQFLACESKHFLHYALCLGALHGELSVVVALVVQVDVEAFGVLLHPGYVLVDVGCIDDEKEVVLAHFIDEQVIDCSAVGVEHHAVVYLPDGCLTDVVGEDVLDVALGIGSRDAYFAHVTDIEHAAMLTDCIVLVRDVCVLNRHDESAEWRHQCAKCHMAVIKTSFLFHR